ncbi:MAG: DNA polymerase III subunit alpha [Bacteroidetes bacterium]|nr:DNA polymerase III subunit alpha [Bacteroidota bacterium]
MHLHLHSNYSFLAGTLSIERIVGHAVNAGYTALALTDINNVSGIMEFYTRCRSAGIQPIPGADLSAGRARAVLLARDWQGYSEICAALTELVIHYPAARVVIEAPTRGSGEEIRIRDGEERVAAGDSQNNGARGNGHGIASDTALLADILLRHCGEHVIILSADDALLRRITGKTACSIYVALSKDNEARWPRLLDTAHDLALPVVATNNVYFGVSGGQRLHAILRAIATNGTLDAMDPGILAAGENYFIGEEEFRKWFRHIPGALTARERIIAECDVRFDLEHSKFASYPDVHATEKMQRLRALAEEGLRARYPHGPSAARDRMEKELEIIGQLGFLDYFLVAWDVVRYARMRAYPYVGRGSGANSIVAYCLRITNVDPIELDLFFERFLNPERRSPPDFDIDFSWRHRDEVINYLLAKYGSDHTAMIGTITTFNPRGALREVGKVFGYSAAEIKQLTSMLPAYGAMQDLLDAGSPVSRRMGPVLNSRYGRQWLRAALAVLDFPNHYGIHSGGVILAPDMMTRYTATQVAPKGVRITQQDMYALEDWRLEKLDILSTRGLGTFEDTMQEVRRRTGTTPPIIDYAVACRDEKTREIMRRGETVGCFYVESPAMIQLLRKLRTDSFEMLTAASSIIRPGVAQSGMMQAFIERFHDRTKIKPPHPKMSELLHSTFGVMVYQEDVIKVAHFIGGLRLGEADLLRRAMSGKMRSHEAMQALRETFFAGCRRQGISTEVAAEIWRQMESFAGYSFCKAHSASYAVLSFQEAWLKAHFPAFFLCAVLNNQGGYYRPEVYIQEARRLGLRVLLPNVNASDELHGCPDDRSIQLGFLHIRNLSQRSQQRLLRERREHGVFVDFNDFLARSGTTVEDAELLIRCGACDCFGDARPAMLVKAKLHRNRNRRNVAEPMLQLRFEDFDEELRQLQPYSPQQVTAIELETFSYAVSTHVLDHFEKELRHTVKSTDLGRFVGRRVHVGGWLIAAKISRTKKGERMMFVNLDDAAGRIDVVLFPRCFSRHAHLLRNTGPFVIYGKVTCEYDVINLIAERVELLRKE